MRASGQGCTLVATAARWSSSLASGVTVRYGNTWNVDPGTQETSLPQIFLGTYYVPCAIKPSGEIEQFKSYPKETNKNPNNLLGVILGMEPKAWH